MTDQDNGPPAGASGTGGDAEASDQEQRRLALQCLVKGWEDALNKGVDPQTVAITALSTGLTGLVDTLGQEGARMVAEKLPEQIAAGYFSPKESQH
ncbi:hypothetical protein [Fodinicurvata sp. EGI_FJ10296]|uniref:hypothetical protein n=1 Tax=Fodinicurvata sp. EGI_FJ10296 TaxID=3231908 RepID=UPI0034516CB9